MKKVILSTAFIAVLAGCDKPESNPEGEVVEEYTVKIIKVKNHDDNTLKERLRKDREQSTLISRASAYIIQAAQLNAATTLYSVIENKKLLNVDDLIPGYISSLPNPAIEFSSEWKIDVESDMYYQSPFIEYPISYSDFSVELCEMINTNGYSDNVSCKVNNSIAKVYMFYK